MACALQYCVVCAMICAVTGVYYNLYGCSVYVMIALCGVCYDCV